MKIQFEAQEEGRTEKDLNSINLLVRTKPRDSSLGEGGETGREGEERRGTLRSELECTLTSRNWQGTVSK